MTARTTSKPHAKSHAKPPARSGEEHLDPYSDPYRDPHPRDPHPRPEPRGRKGRRAHGPATQLTSLPTGRRAYAETRQWLLDRHGPVCAYCGLKYDPELITLDHVTPRRGQTAYDRRDNLVLACKRCNGIKADTSILAFLIARRERAATLLRYGAHLSPMLIDLATQIAGDEAAARAARLADPDYPYAD